MKNCLKIMNEDPFFGELHSRNMDLGARLDIFGYLGFGVQKNRKIGLKHHFFGKNAKTSIKK